ncbi:Retrotransposon gag protein [Arachis hypogaea]|nr:Retrotransposon gag protein [Arachis hypogaea]
MRRNRDKEYLLDFDPEPERTFRQRLQQARLYKAAESTMNPTNTENANAANPNGNEQQRRVLGSYSSPTAYLYGKSIVVPPITTNNFELKPQLVTLVQQNCQYHGLPHEDPNQFISSFLQICDTVKTNGVNPDVYKLMLFPFALRDGAKLWLNSQPKESLDTWNKVVTEFLTKIFQPKKLTKLRIEVQTFRQKDGGSLYKKKTPEEAIELIELVASNQYLYSSNRNPVNSEAPQKKGVIEVEALNAILAQNKLMSQQINLLTQHMGGMQVSTINTQNPPQEISYDIAGHLVQNDNYDYAQSSFEQVNYMGSGSRNPNNDPYSQTYNQGWRNHPNFGWRDQPQRPQNFNNNSQGGFQQNNDLEAILIGFRQKTRASIKNLEIQIGQIATRVNEIDQKTTNSLPKEGIKRLKVANKGDIKG